MTTYDASLGAELGGVRYTGTMQGASDALRAVAGDDATFSSASAMGSNRWMTGRQASRDATRDACWAVLTREVGS